MDRIAESDIKIEATLYKQQGKVEVYKVLNYKTNQTICMKKIFVENVMDATDIQAEFLAMAKLNHPNILSLKSASLGGQNRSITHVLIFMDFFEEGDLEKMIQAKAKSGYFFTESEMLSYINQLVDACVYMQENEAAHRDIKPQNIFVCEQGKKLKIGDLGSAAKKDNNVGSTLIGTPLYLSPKLREVFMANQNMRVVNHNMFKSDVYSLGLTFLYMTSLIPVKDLCVLIDLGKKIKNRIDSLPEDYSIVKKILKEMLEVDEGYRPDFIELKEIIRGFTEQPVLKEKFIMELKKGDSLKVKLTTVEQLIGKCEGCENEIDENELYYIQGHLICQRCFMDFRIFSQEYYLFYNQEQFPYSFGKEGQNFELCENCKYLVHQGITCLQNFWMAKDTQYCTWSCGKCSEQNFVYKNSASYYAACNNNHYYCCVCGYEFNQKSHEICRILYSQLPSFK